MIKQKSFHNFFNENINSEKDYKWTWKPLGIWMMRKLEIHMVMPKLYYILDSSWEERNVWVQLRAQPVITLIK